MNIIIGIVIGWISFYLIGITVKNLKMKKGVKNKSYEKMPFTATVRDSVRHIIFEYDVKRKNNDFLFNILLKGKIVMQLMHRAHFPELCDSESDINFGLALYIPINEWPEQMILKLNTIVEEESEVLRKNKSGKIEYYVIDLGKRVRFNGYFLSRIISEVFHASESEYSSELFSEGNLPYHLN